MNSVLIVREELAISVIYLRLQNGTNGKHIRLQLLRRLLSKHSAPLTENCISDDLQFLAHQSCNRIME